MKDFKAFNQKRFSCKLCGECCGAWKLPVEEHLVELLEANDFSRQILKDNKKIFKKFQDEYHLPKTNGICIFQEKESGFCLIQKHLEEANKPLECKRFPFAFMKDLNDTIHFDTSFYCKAILSNEGDLLDAEMIQSLSKEFDYFRIPEKVLLTPYKEIPFEQATCLASLIREYFYEQLKKSTIQNGYIPLVSFYLSFCKTKKNFQIKDLDDCLTGIPLPIKRIQDINSRIDLVVKFFIKKESFLLDTIKYLCNAGRIKEPVTNEIINLEHLKLLPVEDHENIIYLYCRYILDILDRKALLAHRHNIESLLLATIFTYKLVYLYSNILAYLDNSKSIDLFHIELAIRIVERYYIGHNVRFMEIFRKKRLYLPLKIMFTKG